MRLAIFSFVVMAVLPSALAQPAKVADLAKPPANALEYSIISTVGTHGHSYCWTGPDGTRYGRETLLLRGQLSESDSKIRNELRRDD